MTFDQAAKKRKKKESRTLLHLHLIWRRRRRRNFFKILLPVQWKEVEFVRLLFLSLFFHHQTMGCGSFVQTRPRYRPPPPLRSAFTAVEFHCTLRTRSRPPYRPLTTTTTTTTVCVYNSLEEGRKGGWRRWRLCAVQ